MPENIKPRVVQVSELDLPDELVETRTGYISYRQWCEAEAARLGGWVALSDDKTRIAVFRNFCPKTSSERQRQWIEKHGPSAVLDAGL